MSANLILLVDYDRTWDIPQHHHFQTKTMQDQLLNDLFIAFLHQKSSTSVCSVFKESVHTRNTPDAFLRMNILQQATVFWKHVAVFKNNLT